MNANSTVKKVAVFTSGGDAPGMNAAVRSVVRTAIYNDLHIFGIEGGYDGMINNRIKRLERSDVANIIQKGGTLLKTARSDEFRTKEGRAKAFSNLEYHGIDGLVAIGGNGTYTGAMILGEEYGIPIIGLPGTIDNDLAGTDYTIGFDTAINTAIDAVDKIRDTAHAHNRLFIIEMMGRHAGYIALHAGIGSGASKIMIPEQTTDLDAMITKLKKSAERQKLFNLIIVAEGEPNGGAIAVAEKIKAAGFNEDVRVTIIGHMQRGGAPSCQDRVLASRLGFVAVEALLSGRSGVAAGIISDEVVFTPFKEAIESIKPINKDLLRMAEILAM